MPELIDRQTLLLAIGKTVNNGKTDEMRKGVFAGLEYCRQLIEMQKVVDAEPVRHGRWIPLENGGYRCSSCGHKTEFAPSEMIDPRDYLAYLDKYCGKCGARMDGGAENG